jgi:hypothetical protein
MRGAKSSHGRSRWFEPNHAHQTGEQVNGSALMHQATWPATAHKLTRLQHALGELTPARWQPPTTLPRIGACFVCSSRPKGLVVGVTGASPGQPSLTAAASWPG